MHVFVARFTVPESDFRMTLKMVSVSVRYLFYQLMDEKIKTWTFRFPAKENPNIIGEGIVRLANPVAV